MLTKFVIVYSQFLILILFGDIFNIQLWAKYGRYRGDVFIHMFLWFSRNS